MKRHVQHARKWCAAWDAEVAHTMNGSAGSATISKAKSDIPNIQDSPDFSQYGSVLDSVIPCCRSCELDSNSGPSSKRARVEDAEDEGEPN